MRYTIKLIDGQISCEETFNNSKRYIQNAIEFSKIINKIINEGFTIKKANENIILCSNFCLLKLIDYNRLLNLPIFARLKFHIKKTIENEGFVDLINSQKVKKKCKRINKHSQETIIKVTGLLLTAGVAINVFSATLKNKKQDPNKNGNYSNSVVETQKLETKITINSEEVILDDNLIPENIENKVEINLNFEDLSDTQKAETTKEKYFSIIEEKAKAYGIDPSLMLGICTQERGIHSSKIDIGGGIGLAQVQYDIWIDTDITAYKLNTQTGDYEPCDIHITDEMMRNLETNIELGCVILQNCLINSKYNIPVAIQMYNMGPSSVHKILNKYAKDNNMTVESILSNPEDLGWLEYRNGTPGDPKYLENVNQWLEDNNFKVFNFNTGEEVEITFNRHKTK